LNLAFDDVIQIGCILSIPLISVLVRAFVLPLFGIPWPSTRIRFPSRFSLLALTVLVVLAACTFALLREIPPAAAIGFVSVLAGWLTVVQYFGFRQALADRRNKKLAAMIEERKKQSVEELKR